MKILVTTLAICLTTLLSYGQSRDLYVDGVKVTEAEYKNLDWKNVAGVVKKPDGTYIRTRSAERERYVGFLRSVSPGYASVVATTAEALSVQYIINKFVVRDDVDVELGAVDEHNFVSLTIIDKDELMKRYKVSDRSVGVVISTKR